MLPFSFLSRCRRGGLAALVLLLLSLSLAGARATVLREYWLNLPGNLVSDLTNSVLFPDNPTASDQLATFEAPSDWADNYGTRIRGYITPAVSGPYVLWIASDDYSELWLSTDAGPDNKVLIASVPGWTSSREWNKYPNQQSAPINLVAGQQYYIEALQKEAYGGDNVAAGWAKPGEATSAPSEVIPGSVLTPWTGPLPGYNSRPVITVPTNLWFAEGPLNVHLTATVRDDGNPLPANPATPNPGDTNKLRWKWSVIGQPVSSAGVVWSGHPTNGEAFTYSGSSNAPNTVFTCDPTATLDAPGLYTFQFTANDGARQTINTTKVFVRSSGAYRSLGYNYLSPLPGAEYCSPQTRFILVRFRDFPPSALTNLSSFIQVRGASSLQHAGVTKIASDSHTVIFQMSTDFLANELVTVTLTPGVAAATGASPPPYQYQFMTDTHLPDKSVPALGQTVDPQAALLVKSTGVSSALVARSLGSSPTAPSTPIAGLPGPVKTFPAPVPPAGGSRSLATILGNGVSVPSDFPFINITVNNNPDPEYIFIDNRGGNGHPYNVIFDNSGNPVWYSRYPDERRDMKVQPNGVLTMLARDLAGNHFNGFNTNYQLIKTFWATNGYGVDEHELQVFKDGTYLLVALRGETIDMTRFVPGGNPAAGVTEQAIQEFTPAGELIFQWRALDHIDIRDQAQFIDLTGGGFDFPHFNAIDHDTDGNLLFSARSTSECFKIDRETGQIIWVLGGAANQLNFVNDPLGGPRNQHALRNIATNHYTLFDNGDLHSPSVSRAVEFVVDPTNLTATVAWQYPSVTDPSLYSFYMGDVQRLPNGNTLIDWAVGNLPKLTEVRPDGSKAFEMNWVSQFEAYRTWRCAWRGVALQPYLILEPYPDSLALLFNQFGDTNVAYYRIYGGPTPHPTRLLATSVTTLKSLSNLTNGLNYFRVTAVNTAGVEGPFSNEENLTVNIIKPGQNMATNGDFSLGTNGWTWTVSGAAAAWQVEAGVAHAYLTNGGATFPSAQLGQSGITLSQGRQYVLQFDAWSLRPRYIDVRVAQSVSPFTDYSRITTPFLTPTHAHYKYVFTMTSVSDSAASLLFNLGSSTADVFLDNITLYYPPVGDFNADTRVDYLDLANFSANWLKKQLNLPADLDGNAQIDFRDLGIFGENWPAGIP